MIGIEWADKIPKIVSRGKKSRMRLGALILLFIFLVCSVGCVSPIPLSTTGTASTHAPVAFSNEGAGKGESFWIAKYEDVIAASLRTGEVLSLELKEERIERDQAFFRFYDEKNERIDLIIERRTDTMTSINFRVGWYGSVAFGRLMARQIIIELDKSKSFLEDWTPEKTK